MKLKEDIRVCELCGATVKAHKFLFENSLNKKVSDVCLMFNDTGIKHIHIIRKNLYNKIPKEKKQAFLDNFRKGMNVGESYKAANLTQEEGFAVLDENIKKNVYHTLNEVAE